MESLAECCAPNVKYIDTMVPVSNNVSLRVIHFIPPEKNKYPSVIFVAGWITQIEAWQKVLREMTKDFTVYYMETREKISSEVKGKADFTIQALGKDLVELVKYLKLAPQSYIMLGSSLGATAILESCQYLKADPLGIILIGPNASFHIPKLGLIVVRLFHPVMYLIIKPVIKWYLKTFRLDSEADYAQYRKYCNALDAANPYRLKKMALSLPTYHVWDYIDRIEYPALFIGASKDLLHDKDIIQRMVSRMKNGAYLDMYTNALTHSEGVVDEIRKYVAGLLASSVEERAKQRFH